MKCTTCGITVIGVCFDGSRNCLPPGTKVRFSESLKQHFKKNGSYEHLKEFRDQVGTVVGHAEKNWPEIDVEFAIYGTTLRYSYPATQLEVVGQ